MSFLGRRMITGAMSVNIVSETTCGVSAAAWEAGTDGNANVEVRLSPVLVQLAAARTAARMRNLFMAYTGAQV